MSFVQEFLRDKTPARLLMIAAIALLFVSQFFLYFDDQGSGYIPNAMNLEEYTQVVITSYGAVGTGWELHPHAYVFLVILAFAFLRDDIAGSALFSKVGWWISLILVVASVWPGAYLRAPGAMMGGIAVLMALAAVLIRQSEARQERSAEAKAAKP